MANGLGWTEDRVEQLKELWGEGLSCSQIARALGGVSRNGVIGKVHRLGLDGRKNAPARTYRTPLPKMKREPVASKPKPPPVTPLCEPETWAPKGTCLHIEGDTHQPGWRMCGHPAVRKSSWCDFHFRICHAEPRASC